MDTRELLRTLSSCQFHQRYLNQSKIIESRPTPTCCNWEQRREMKTQILIKYLKIIFCTFLTLNLFIVVPFMVGHPPYGKSIILSIPPILFITLTWMIAAWWAWDKEKTIFFIATMGAVPLRIGVCLMWGAICFSIPGINQDLFLLSSMGNWIAFTSIEIAMILEFSKKFPTVSGVEPIK